MLKRGCLTLLSVLLLISFSLYSQEKWSLEKCIQYALEHNIQIKIQELSKNSAQTLYLKNKTNFLPSLNGNANQGYAIGRSIDPLTNEFAESNVNSNNFSISANWTLFSGLQNVNTLRQSYYNLQSGLMDLQKAQNDIALNVAASFLQILLSDELLTAAKNQYDLSKLQVERTKLLYLAGSVSQSNYLDMESQFASDEMQLVSAQNTYNLAYLTLTQLLELGIADSITIEKPLIATPDSIFPNINLQSTVEEALRNLPDIKSAEYKMLAAEKGLQAARGSRSPRLTLSGSYASGYSSQRKEISNFTLGEPLLTGYAIDLTGNQNPVYSYNYSYNYKTTDFQQQLKDNVSKNLSINLSIPIFNNWQANYEISSAKINSLNAKYSYDQTQKQIIKEVQQAYYDAVAAFNSFNAAKKAVKASAESFKYAEQRYNLGLANTYDYNLAKTNFIKAQSEEIKSKYDYIFKLKILDFYCGKPFKL